ncbi:MAG: heat-inducible transcriptional repressor HrcA [Candidatus Caldatribacteriota bacterium]|nr:heat-inducible transcriptional repressor HrcA [Candidatus Caldatribacteriota bacterium]
MKRILAAVAHRYITYVEPVSSSTIAREYNLNLSTATIRHELFLLEKDGYLWHPHTSSGRIPTDKGYRFYVDNLMQKSYLSKGDKDLIIRIYKKSKEFEYTMKSTSQLLSQLTDNIGVVLGPIVYNNLVDYIQFNAIGNDRILVIIVTDTGLVYQKIINISGEITKDNLNYLSNYINSKLKNKDINLIDLNSILIDELEKFLSFQRRFNYIHNFLKECFNFEYLENKIYLDGRINIIKKPEFKEADKLNYILSFIEEEGILAKVIKEDINFEDTKITIGRENRQKEIQNCSLISSKYNIRGRPSGVIMILGPTRMNYSRMVSVVEYISDKLSEVLSKY